MNMNRRSRIVAIGLAAGLAVPLAAPDARAGMLKPSAAEQKRIGAQAAKEVASQYRFVGGARHARVQRVASRLVRALPAKERAWNYSFKVVDSKELNAFALPGGPVYIHSGLLDRLDDHELAAVLSHEIAHVHKEHWASQVEDNQKRSLGLGILLGATKADKGWYDVAGVANSLVHLRYSRKDEDQADASGLSTMTRAGYNPNGMLGLFQELQKGSKSSGTPEFLRSHPLTSDRVKKTRQRIAAMR